MDLRMMRRHLAAAALLGIAMCAGAQVHAQGYSINTGAAPVTGTAYTTVDDGWGLTPTSTFGLTSIGTDFAPYNGATSRTVTAVVYTGLPGGNTFTKVDSGTATVTGAGGNITFTMTDATPYTILSGTEYFIGFEGVAGLGYNFTSNGTSATGGARYTDQGGDTFSSKTILDVDPIISLNSSLAIVPEPDSFIGMGIGVMGLMGLMLRNRKRYWV